MKYNFSIISLFTIFFLAAHFSSAQVTIDPDTKSAAFLFNANFGGMIPTADMSDRFGFFNEAGGGGEFITKTDWSFGLDVNYQFGINVKEDVFSAIRDENGVIFGNNYEFALTELRMRGLAAQIQIGKTIPVFRDNERSGIFFGAGFGWQEHRMRLQQDPQSFIAQIDGDYADGYDRLTGGPLIRESVGLRVMSENRLVNFKLTLEAAQAFTKSKRDWNYNTNTSETDTKRSDMYYGIRISWALPFFFDNSDEIRYY